MNRPWARSTAGRSPAAGPPKITDFPPPNGKSARAFLNDMPRESRSASVRAGIEALPSDAAYVLVHDGARPLVSEAVIANIISALSIHAGLLSDKVFAETMAPTVGGALEFILRAGKRDAAVRPLASACRAAVDLFTAAGDGRAADQARRAWERASSPWPVPSLPLPPLPAFGGGGSLVPDDPQRLAADVRSFVGQLVSMEPDGTIDVLRGFEESWRGQSVEVRNAPTPFGRLSFAIRWHGARPALLWDVVTSETTSATAAERHGTSPVAGTLRLRCSALDPTWTATGISGEALLGI